MNKTFQPRDFIVTTDGQRGYVTKRIDFVRNSYEVRLASGVEVKLGIELEHDPLMMEDGGYDRFETCSMCYED
jgi:hypothetical protein